MSSWGLEGAFAVGFFTWLGHVADEAWSLSPFLTLAGFLLGFSLAVVTLLKALNRLERIELAEKEERRP